MLPGTPRVRRWPPFYRTMLSGTAATVAIVTITAAVVFSFVVGREMRQSSRAFNHELLLQTRKVVETALGEALKTAFTLSQNPDVTRVLDSAWDVPADHRIFLAVQERLDTAVASSAYLASFDLCHLGRGKVLSNGGMIETALFRDRELLGVIDGAPGSLVWTGIRSRPVGSTLERVFSLVLPVRPAWQRGQYLAANLREQLLLDAAALSADQRIGDIMILDGDGGLLHYRGRIPAADLAAVIGEVSRRLDGPAGSFLLRLGSRREMVAWIASEVNGWRYVSLAPSSAVSQRSSLLSLVAVAATALLLGVGMLLSLVASRRSYRLISRRFSENEALLRDFFLQQLLLGCAGDAADVDDRLQYHRVPLGGGTCRVLVARRCGGEGGASAEQQSRHSFLMRSVLGELVGTRGIAVPMDAEHCAVLLNEPDGGLDPRDVPPMHATLEHRLGCPVIMGVGEPHPGAHGIPLSYQEALEALQYSMCTDTAGIVRFHDIVQEDRTTRDDARHERLVAALAGALRDARPDEARRALGALMSGLHDEAGMSLAHKRALLAGALHAMLAATATAGVPAERFSTPEGNVYYRFSRLRSFAELSTWFDRFLDDCERHLRRTSTDRQRELVATIAAIIERRHASPLSVRHVADEAGLHHAYVARVFKAGTGASIARYLNDVRIRKAQELLAATDRTLDDIAAVVGFGTKLNIIRAFKRATGTTPSSYRRMRRGEPARR